MVSLLDCLVGCKASISSTQQDPENTSPDPHLPPNPLADAQLPSEGRSDQDATVPADSQQPNDGRTTDTGVPPPNGCQTGGQCALEFFGHGANRVDRVEVDVRGKPINIGAGDFTIEFFVKVKSGNSTSSCYESVDAWTNGNILIDRDIWSNDSGQTYGDFGIAYFAGQGGRIAFAVGPGASGAATFCSTHSIGDGNWHHVAVTRVASNGRVRIFIDGTMSREATATTANVSYTASGDLGRSTNPLWVIAAEKHDVGYAFSGVIDEVRVSTTARYSTNFSSPTAPFSLDASTAALYHFDEATGTQIIDVKGESHAVRRVGGTPEGPRYVSDVPF